MDRPVLLAALLGMITLAGCLGDDGADTPDDGQDLGPESTGVPAGCRLDDPAIVHGPGGTPAATSGPTGYACFVRTPWGTGEPSLGVTGDGTLFLYPAMQTAVPGQDNLEQFVGGMGIARLGPDAVDEGDFTRHVSEVAGAVNWHPYTADPFMFVEPYTDRVFMEDLLIPPFNCANLSFSDDLGETWTQSLAGCLTWDHVGYGSGPATVSNPSYPVVIQRCAITYVATTVASEATGCQKSLDGGMTWEAPGEPPFLFDQTGTPYVPATCNGAAHHPHVDHRGWTWIGRLWCDQKPWIALSKDEGATWDQFQISDEVAASWHDVAVGADLGGNVYAFWIDADLRPVLAVSTDDGATWSAPIDIGPPGLVAAGMANIAPGGVGKAGFTYAAEIDGRPGVHAIAAAGYGLHTDAPVFHSAIATPADDALRPDGNCSSGLCDGQADFLDATIGPDGSVWGSFDHTLKVGGGRLWGAPSLWDADDPNGPFADGA